MGGTVKLRYGAWSNITFHGVIDTEVEREDWEEMTMQEQNDVMSEALFRIVDVDVIDDDDEEGIDQ